MSHRPKKDIRDAMEAVIKVYLTKSMLSMAREPKVSFSTIKDKVKVKAFKATSFGTISSSMRPLKKSRLDRGKKHITYKHRSSLRTSGRPPWGLPPFKTASSLAMLCGA